MSWYGIIHGPEIWLALVKLCIALIIFDLGVLAGMWLSALFGANGRDDDEQKDDP